MGFVYLFVFGLLFLFCLHRHMCSRGLTGACRGQKKTPNPLKLTLLMVVSQRWVLGIKPGPSERATSVLNC